MVEENAVFQHQIGQLLARILDFELVGPDLEFTALFEHHTISGYFHRQALRSGADACEHTEEEEECFHVRWFVVFGFSVTSHA